MTKNGWQINYSEVYEKFQVSANGVIYEEFSDIKDAIRFAENN